MADPITGDSNAGAQDVVITASNDLNVVTLAKLSDKDDPINDFNVSGKKAGSMLIMNSSGAHEVVVAQGRTDVSPWTTMGTTPVDITPA